MTTSEQVAADVDPYQLPPLLAAALSAFQAELPTIGKGNTAQVRSDKGNYSYNYADLADVSAAVLPLLGKHGMAWRTLPTMDPQGRFALRYDLTHGKSGESTGGWWPLQQGTPQQMGSAITYARRYTLCAVTGVAPDNEDDDGAAAQHTRRAQDRDAEQPQAQRPPQQRTNGQQQPQAAAGRTANHEDQRSATSQPTAADKLRAAVNWVLRPQSPVEAENRMTWAAKQADMQGKKVGDLVGQDPAEVLGLDDARRSVITLLELSEAVCNYLEKHGKPVIAAEKAPAVVTDSNQLPAAVAS